jgi:formylglycine-generating enzyme required for sulfatase activity
MHLSVFAAPLAMLGVAAIPTCAVDESRAQALPAVTFAGTTLHLVRIPSGEFLMGSDRNFEKPPHRVQIRSFDMGRTEVTVRQFRAFTEATGYKTEAEREGSAWICHGSKDDTVVWRSRGYWTAENGRSWRDPGFPQTDDHPAVALSWIDAVEFCKWLSSETGDQYRLPSEAEWEYAARAGSKSEPSDLNQVAWYKVNADVRSHPVGEKKPNAWNVHDMLGNAWEWVADIWSENYSGAPTDGSARLDGGTGVGPLAPGDVRPLRGGGWCLESAESRFSARAGFGLHQRCNNSGFRVARSFPMPSK